MPEENTDFMQELDRENRETMEDYLEKIRREAYRYCEEAIITDVDGKVSVEATGTNLLRRTQNG